MRLVPTEPGSSFGREDLLRWLFVGRLTLAAGIFAGAIVAWGDARADQTLLATVLFVFALLFTGGSFWWVFVLERRASDNFSYLQVAFDALLVTGIVHITGGAGSFFAPVYILVITVGALLLPLRGGVLLAVLASILFLADVVWFHGEVLSWSLVLQVGLFTVVALVTGWVGDRLRRAGLALGEVESELRRLRLDTSDILEQVGTGVMTIEGDGRLAYLNTTGGRLLGLDGDQWQGAPVLDAVESVAPRLAGILRASIRDRTPFARYKVVAEREEEEVTLGVSTTLLEHDDDAEAPSVTALFQDITDQERLRALNRRNERLEAVTELSASLAHEIKNPLASIRSAVEQLTRPTLDDDDRTTLRNLVVGESERLSRLLSEFIEFSAVRMTSTDQVDLAQVVRDSVDLVRQHPEADGAGTIELEGVEESVSLPGDADLLHRSVFNLVLNAVQFSGPEGRVAVRLEDCRPGANPRGTRIQDPVRLSVRDTGPGIPPEEQARIFDPFYTRRAGGSGLGLALVHRAVEAHEGAIFVDSPPGGGTEFVLFLPGRRQPATEEVDL